MLAFRSVEWWNRVVFLICGSLLFAAAASAQCKINGQPFGTALGALNNVAVYSNCNASYDPVIISAATNTYPVIFTAASHGLDTNGIQRVTIYGATGNWAAANGTYTVTVIDANMFSIPVNAASLGALTGTLAADYDNPLGTGLEWQSVEYVRRYWATVYATPVGLLSGMNASQLYSGSLGLGLHQYQNGVATTPPQVGDIIVSQGPAGSNGHAAIVSSVTASQVCAVMQNFSENSSDADGSHCMAMTASAPYSVDAFDSPTGGTVYAVQGWIRYSVSASPVVLSFDSLQCAEFIQNYYAGGHGSLGSGPGPDYGMIFSANAQVQTDASDPLPNCASQIGGGQNTTGMPSPLNGLMFQTGTAAIMNVPGGLTTGLAFYYAAPFLSGYIDVWSGQNGTGTLLATLKLPITGGCANSPQNCVWQPAGVSFSGTAGSVDFGGSANFIVFDNITLGASNPAMPAALTVTTSHGGSFTQGQSGAPYTVTISNPAGAGVTTGLVTVTETVPAGMTLVSLSGSSWNCTVLPTCTTSSALNGGWSYPPITVTVNVAANATSPQVNEVSVSGGGSVAANALDLTVIRSNPAVLTIALSHSGNFTVGQTNATYTVTVSNGASSGPTNGAVTVSEAVPAGLTLVSMSGTGWTCPAGGTACTRSDVLSPGASYPAITVTVSVTSNATSPQINQVSVSGGGSATVMATDTTSIAANSPFACFANGAMPLLRPEGYTELLGDLVISCMGGAALVPGTPVPTANITVYFNANLTNRLFAYSNGLSDAVLILDDAGSGLLTGPAGYGSQAPQQVCGSQAGCPAFAAMNSGYEVMVSSSGGAAPAQNVYQGYLSQVAANTVTFYNVPILAPAFSGTWSTFRITNLRFPAVGMTSQQQVAAYVATSPSTMLQVPPSSAVALGVVGQPMIAAVTKTELPFVQSSSPGGPALSATIAYSEGSAGMFKTRVVPVTNTTYAAEGVNNASQNIPGSPYGGLAADSESGLVLSTDTGGSSGNNLFTAGLADFGTRLKAVFTNIPAGITLYVSTTSTSSGYPVPGGTSTAPYAILVAANSGEAASDGTAFTPLTSAATGSDGFNALALTPNSSGAATAVWEVVNADPAGIDTLSFSVYVNYTGTPAITGQAGAPVNNVTLSFAPEPGSGAFNASAAASPGTNIIPRFAVPNPYQGSWVSIVSSNVPPPAASVLMIPPTASYNYTWGEPLPSGQTLSVSSNPTGTAGLILSASAGCGWLSASLAASTAPTSINTSIVAAALPAPGIYTCTLTVDGTGVAAGASTTVTLTVTAYAFFSRAISASGMLYMLLPDGVPFGYFVYEGANWIRHADLGIEYICPGNDAADSIYLWDMTSGHWWYTNISTFPYLYDFTLNTWLYYFPDIHNPGQYLTGPRRFANMATAQVITM